MENCVRLKYLELKKDTPAPDNAIFNVASLSKPISTLLTLQLVSNGDWDLDEPLYHYWVDPDDPFNTI
jgi:CubicO group peptidase (beta-lactamase class C family)